MPQAGTQDPKWIGDVSEAKVLAALVEAGIPVFLPWGDRHRYDMVIEKDGEFLRVQCKTGRWVDGTVRFSCSSWHQRHGKRDDYAGEADLFAIYSAATERTYLVPVDECGTNEASLRVSPTANGQRRGIRWAKDYEV